MAIALTTQSETEVQQEVTAYQCQGTNVNPMGTLRAGNGNESGGVPFVPVAFALRGRESGAIPEVYSDGSTIGSLRAASGGSSRDYLALEGHSGEKTQADARALLLRVREALGEEAFAQWGLGVSHSLQSTQVLRQDVYGEELRQSSGQGEPLLVDRPSESPQDSSSWPVRALREAKRLGCPSSGRGLDEQLARELATYLQKLSHHGASDQILVRDLWSASEGLGVLRKALSAIQEIWRSADVQTQPTHATTAVRRLTPVETLRLQGFPDTHLDVPIVRIKHTKACEEAWDDEAEPGDDLCICGAIPKVTQPADGPKYRAVGNSKAVVCVSWLGRRIDAAERGADPNELEAI